MTFFSTFFDEAVNSINKIKLAEKTCLYSIGALNHSVGAIIFLLINAFKGEFRFAFASLPTFSARAILEIILSYYVLIAIDRADRSTFGFIRVLTIPMLLLVDFILGYRLNNFQLAGIVLIAISLLIIFLSQGIKKQGAGLAFLTAVMAVATISLYKYDITHFNSVAAEQSLIDIILVTFFVIMAIFKNRENPLNLLKQKIFRWQILANAIPGFVNSYAYAMAPASVILSTYRSASVFWSVVSGKAVFREEGILIKSICLIVLVFGIILLIL